jgi:hypothetical protein
MAVFDVTHIFKKTDFDSRKALIDWLTGNVGEFIGGPYKNGNMFGHGWEIRYDVDMDMFTDDIDPKWVVDIVDGPSATYFGLIWS